MSVLNLQVGASANDGYVFGASNFNNSSNVIAAGYAFGNPYGSWVRFTGVSGLSNETISSAYVEFYVSSYFGVGGSVNHRVALGDSPSAPGSFAGFWSASRSTASVGDSFPSSGPTNDWVATASLVPLIQELADNHNPTVIQVFSDGFNPSSDGIFSSRTYDFNTSLAAKLHIEYGNTAPTITVNPSVNYNGYTRTGPNNTPISVGFTATDAEETGSNALSYEIRTASGSGGTLVASGNFTSGTPASVNIAHNASGINEGSNTLWLRVYDGSEYAPTNPSFTLLVDRTQPTVGTITHSPNPVTP